MSSDFGKRIIKGGRKGLPDLLESRPVDDSALAPLGISPYCPRSVGADGKLVERECALPEALLPPKPEPAPEPTPPPEPKVDVDSIRRRAFEEGATEGERRGAEKAGQEHAQELAKLRSALEELLSYKDALRVDAERELLDLAFAVARRIVRRELTIDNQIALAIVRSCLKDFTGSESRRIRVNERDVDLVREQLGTPLEVEVISDPSVSAGGAVLETDQGRLDARIETQLSEIESGLADGYG